jgi:IS1 family transposase
MLRNLTFKRLQLDEIWSFVYAKEKSVQTAETAREKAGDVWTWVAIDADSKLVPSWRIGDRTLETGLAFVDDLAKRLANRVQITSDGHRAYLEAIEGAFGGDVDYAMLVKLHGDSPESAKGRYSSGECTGAIKTKIEGNPDLGHVSTSYAKRQNLTMRMSIRRLTRVTNAFSKKIEKHALSVALHYMHYNFARIHKTLRVSAALAAGMTDKLWSVVNIVAMKDAEIQTDALPARQQAASTTALSKGRRACVAGPPHQTEIDNYQDNIGADPEHRIEPRQRQGS